MKSKDYLATLKYCLVKVARARYNQSTGTSNEGSKYRLVCRRIRDCYTLGELLLVSKEELNLSFRSVTQILLSPLVTDLKDSDLKGSPKKW